MRMTRRFTATTTVALVATIAATSFAGCSSPARPCPRLVDTG